ncbi:MAG TPA: carbohydrate-binding protein [Puia sp.]
MKHLLLKLTFPVLLFPILCFAQGDQTIINVPINSTGGTEKAILHLPDDYGQTTTKYPLMVFLHGVGEGSLTDPSTIYNSSSAGGPAYIIAHGSWPSSFVNPVDKKSYKYIVVCPQAAYGTSTSAPALEVILSWLVKTYRVDESRLYLTGISAGGEGVLEYVGKIQASGQAVSATHKVAALIPMSAVMNAYYRGQYADNIVKDNVQLWGFGSATDVHGANTLNLVLDVNADRPNYAISTAYSGGHCCWEQFYNPTYRLNGKSIYEWALQYTQGVSAPPSTPPAAPVVNPVAVPGKVEAEGYSAMSGVATESTADAGGGLDVGWIDQGDYMDYSVNVAAAGQYTVGFRVATPNAGASFQLTKTDGTVLSTVKVPNTGGYQSWQTVTATVTLAAGVQTLRIKSVASPIWNINWMQLTQIVSAPPAVSIPGKIEGEAYSAMAGVAKESTADAGGGQDVGWIDVGDYMDYSVNVASAGQYSIGFRVAAPGAGAVLQLMQANGAVLTTVSVPNTGGFQTWQTVTATVTLPAGVQTLRIKSTGSSDWNFNWMQFAQSSAPGAQAIPGKIEAESYTVISGGGTQATTDAGGGLNVGWVDVGNYMDYYVNVGAAGQYAVSFRTATPNSGASLQLTTTAGAVLSTVNVPRTSGWQIYQTVTANVTLAAGAQTIRVKCTGSTWNLNWLQFVKSTTSTATEGDAVSRNSAFMSDSTTAIGDELTLFPNPAHDQVTLRMNNEQIGKMQVQLIDGVGSVKAAYNFSKTSNFIQVNIPASNLSAGVYFVRIQVGNKLEIKKIVKL